MKKTSFWAVFIITWGFSTISAAARTMTVNDMAGRQVGVPFDPEHMADEIYTFLVGKPVYQDMKKDYGSIGRKAPFLN